MICYFTRIEVEEELSVQFLDSEPHIWSAFFVIAQMIGNGESTGFEMGIVVPKKKELDFSRVRGFDCVDSMVMELDKVGLMVERVQGISNEFIKIAAPIETMGRAAAELQLKKMTSIGMDLQFEWDQREAFVRQPDGSLFSWCERLSCFHHIIYGIVNKKRSKKTMWLDGKEFFWYPNESLLKRMKSEGIIKLIFPLHDETNRKHLLRNWAFNWLDFTWQPIDEIYSYFGTKIATYFSFLGMYTRWLFFPASFGLAVHLIDFGYNSNLVLMPFFDNSHLGLSWGYMEISSQQFSLQIRANICSPCILCICNIMGCVLLLILEAQEFCSSGEMGYK